MEPKGKVILTGDRPTGPLHLGHYTGALASRVRLQSQYHTYVLIADLQALTDNSDRPEIVSQAVWEVLLDNLAVGLDPEQVTFVLQSGVPELAELTQLYLNLVTLARLQRNPTVKDEMRDITGFEADLVPVGEDQLPVVEQTREIVRRFNSIYGDTLVMPEPMTPTFGARLPGTDGSSKMGASLGNAINLSDPPEVVRGKVMKMYTDPTRKRATDPGHVEGNPVFAYLDAFDPDQDRVSDLKAAYRAGRVGDVAVKEHLAEVLLDFLEPIQGRRTEWEQRREQVREVLLSGTAQGRQVVTTTLRKALSAVGLPSAADMQAVSISEVV
jgi:tryptophanyl-tRNA synthetase